MSAASVVGGAGVSHNSNANNGDEFDEVEESLLSYKRFTKRLRHTIVNPFFIGASFAVGLSIGTSLSKACFLFQICFSIVFFFFFPIKRIRHF